MIDPGDRISLEKIFQVRISTRYQLPLYLSRVAAGFTSPAENFVEARLDINELCIRHPDATYFAYASGESMQGDRILPGDLLVVDADIIPANGAIALVELNREFCVKRIVYKDPMIVLESSNERYLPIYVYPEVDDFNIVGSVTYVIFKPSKYPSYADAR